MPDQTEATTVADKSRQRATMLRIMGFVLTAVAGATLTREKLGELLQDEFGGHELRGHHLAQQAIIWLTNRNLIRVHATEIETTDLGQSALAIGQHSSLAESIGLVAGGYLAGVSGTANEVLAVAARIEAEADGAAL